MSFAGTCPKCGHTGTLDTRHAPDVIGTEAFGALAIKATARVWGVSVSALKSKMRSSNLVLARACAADIMRNHGEMTWQQAGQALGGRDHSTVLTCVQKYGADTRVIAARRKALRQMALC